MLDSIHLKETFARVCTICYITIS